MSRISRYLPIAVLALGVVSLVIGIAFVAEAQIKSNWMKDAMRQEKITLGLDANAIAKGEVVDDAAEAQKAGDKVRGDRHKIAPTYNDLLGGKPFDPSNPSQVKYMQALNLENYLYLSVLGFGVTKVILVTGIVMIIVGIALGTTGLLMFGLRKAPVAGV